MYTTILVTHGDLAQTLIDTIEKILGRQKNTYCFSNKTDSLPVLAQKINRQIEASQAEHLVFFTDLKGGSCWTLVNMIRREYPGITLISGVNLPMLVTYFNNLENLPFEALIEKTLSDGCRGISSIKGS